MQKFIIYFYIILRSIFSPLLAQQTNLLENQSHINFYVVVIGISQYENKAIQSLTYANKDASLFAEFLQS